MKKTNGITLIALVITIIVLLILAGVSISAITGENGIVGKAKDAAQKTDAAQKEEAGILDGYEEYLNSSDSEDEVSDVLRRYVLGEDEKGIDVNTIIDEDTFTFKNDDNTIADASTSITLINFTHNDEYVYGDIKYEDDFYKIIVDASTGYTKELEKYELKSVYSGNIKFEAQYTTSPVSMSATKKYLLQFTINGEETFFTTTFGMMFANPTVSFGDVNGKYAGVMFSNYIISNGFVSEINESVLENIYEIGADDNCILEDGFLLGYVNDNRGWALCGTPSGEYVVPQSIGGKDVTCVINDAISGVPTFSHVVTLPNWGDPIKITEAKVTINDNEFIEHVLNAFGGYSIDIDLTECGDSITFSDAFLRTYGDRTTGKIYVTAAVKEAYTEYDAIAVK